VTTVFLNRYFFPDHSATSQLLTDLAFFLAREQGQVNVVTSRQRYDDAKAGLAPVQTVGGVVIHRVWTTCFGRGRLGGRALDYLTFYTSAAWRLFRLLRPGDVVVAKTDPPLLSVIAAPIARLCGAKLVNWHQDVFPEVASRLGVRGLNGAPGGWLRGLRDKSLNSADCNVVAGRRMRDYLLTRGVHAARVQVAENWSDGQLIRPLAAADNRLRSEWGLDGKFVVGYSGNMGRVHEFGTVLDAAERLRDEAHVVFVFIGDGNWRPWIAQEVERRGLTNFVFKPYQPRTVLRKSLSVADVHVVSLRPELEGFVVPSKFYGIAASGRATLFVGDPDGEIGRLVREFDCGRAIRQGDADGLANAIRELASDRRLRERLGRNARAAFEANWDKPIACEKWATLLAELTEFASRDAASESTSHANPL